MPHCLARARLTADKDERLQNARANRQSGQKQNVIVVTFSVMSVVSQGRPHRHRGECSGHTLVSTFDKTENFKTGTRPASTRTTICFETSASSACVLDWNLSFAPCTRLLHCSRPSRTSDFTRTDTTVIASFTLLLKAKMTPASIIGSLCGIALPVPCVCFNCCCCYRLLFSSCSTLGPVHSF